MSLAHPLKWWERNSRRRNFKRFRKEAELPGTVALFMLAGVILPTVIVQGEFTVMTAWEVVLTILLSLSLRLTGEQ